MRRRILRAVESLEERFLQQIRGGREEFAPATRTEVFLVLAMLFFVVIMGVAALYNSISASLVGMVAMVFLVMAFMLVTSNYLVATGRFSPRTIMYWYVAAVGFGLLVAYAVATRVMPLVIENIFPSQFEFLLNWMIWFIPIMLVIGTLIMALAAPPRRE